MVHMGTDCDIERLGLFGIDLLTRGDDRLQHRIEIAGFRFPARTGSCHCAATLMSHDDNHAGSQVLNGIFQAAECNRAFSPAEWTTNSSPSPTSKNEFWRNPAIRATQHGDQRVLVSVKDFRCSCRSR